jgi:hypothetical protein
MFSRNETLQRPLSPKQLNHSWRAAVAPTTTFLPLAGVYRGGDRNERGGGAAEQEPAGTKPRSVERGDRKRDRPGYSFEKTHWVFVTGAEPFVSREPGTE